MRVNEFHYCILRFGTTYSNIRFLKSLVDGNHLIIPHMIISKDMPVSIKSTVFANFLKFLFETANMVTEHKGHEVFNTEGLEIKNT